VNAQNHDQKQQKEEEEEDKGFTLESLDESLLFHDTWLEEFEYIMRKDRSLE
jgi:hypothetical protein